jgi:hypothetical protein
MFIFIAIAIGLTIFGMLAVRHGVDSRDGWIDPRGTQQRGDLS